MEGSGVQMLRCAATSVAGRHMPKQHESKDPLQDHRQQIKEPRRTPRRIHGGLNGDQRPQQSEIIKERADSHCNLKAKEKGGS